MPSARKQTASTANTQGFAVRMRQRLAAPPVPARGAVGGCNVVVRFPDYQGGPCRRTGGGTSDTDTRGT